MRTWILGIVFISLGVIFIITIRLGKPSRDIGPFLRRDEPLKEMPISHERKKAKFKFEADFPEEKDWIEVTPPGNGEIGISLADVAKSLEQAEKIDPRNIEAIPPEDGKKGLTLAEVEEIINQQNQIDPTEIEVTPPEKPSERGVTLAKVESIISQQKDMDIEDMEVTPPEHSGERGFTVREMEEIIKQQNEIEIKSIEKTWDAPKFWTLLVLGGRYNNPLTWTSPMLGLKNLLFSAFFPYFLWCFVSKCTV